MNACVIVIQPNFLHLNTEKPSEYRTKKSDNTTRLHIVYGYDNFDAYSLRFDFCSVNLDV